MVDFQLILFNFVAILWSNRTYLFIRQTDKPVLSIHPKLNLVSTIIFSVILSDWQNKNIYFQQKKLKIPVSFSADAIFEMF